MSSTGALYVPQSETVYIGTQGAGGYLEKTLVFTAPQVSIENSTYNYDLKALRLTVSGTATGNVYAVAGIPVPAGAEIVEVSALLRRNSASAFAVVDLFRISGSTQSDPLATLDCTVTNAWQEVVSTMNETVAAGDGYAFEVHLFSDGGTAERVQFAWFKLVYRVEDYKTGY